MGMDAQAIKDAADLPAIVEMLTGAPGRNGMYHCPICGSGSGPNGSPAFHIDPARGNQHWHCFSAKCGLQGDVFDLAGYMLSGGSGKVDDFKAQRRQVMEWAGLLDDGGEAMPPEPHIVQASRRGPAQRPTPDDDPAGPEREREALEAARSALESSSEAIAYLEGRGIGLEAARSLGIGWDAASRRVTFTFPGSDHYHVDRTVDPGARPKYLKPPASRVGRQPIWNPDALGGPVVIVVEGPMDAAALTLAGYGAETVALCGTAYAPLADALREREYRGVVLAALDADGPGAEAQGAMLAYLADAGIAAAPLTLEGDGGDVGVWEALGAKDAGEAWERDARAMGEAVGKAIAHGRKRAERERASIAERAYRATLERMNVVPASTALVRVYAMDDDVDPVPTGFKGLDAILGGGMGPGLYVLGATSSLGKTTLLGQIADHVATGGRPVLFATLEMSAGEMVAKGASRYLATHPAPDGRTHVIGSLNLMRRSWREGPFCSGADRDAIAWGFRAYSESLGDHLYLTEAKGEPTIDDIRDQAYHIRNGEGQPPVVIIDYLQILKTPEGSLSDKQAIDRNVSALRRLASPSQLGTPVIAISSLNRRSYSGTVGLEAFKESGAIEYGSDVLMGMQPANLGDQVSDISDEKRAQREARKLINDSKLTDVREVEVTVLKNRWGKITGEREGVRLTYHTIANRFVEPGER